MAITKSCYIATSVISVLLAGVAIGAAVYLMKLGITAGTPESNNENGTSNEGESSKMPMNYQSGLIIKTSENIIYDFGLCNREKVILVNNSESDMILNFDFYLNKTLYYSSFGKKSPILSLSGEYPHLVQPVEDWHAIALAVDFLSEKVYVYDNEGSKINIFDVEGKHYSVALSDLYKIKDIALDPYRHFMFMSTSSSIAMANMDGTNIREIIKMDYIGHFTLDIKSGILYWSNKTNEIMSCHYDTDKECDSRKIIASTSDEILNLAALDDSLFIVTGQSSNENKKLYHCKIVSGTCQGQYDELPIEQPEQIKVYNENQFLEVNNPCEKQNGECEHLCVLAELNHMFSCKCDIGWQLNSDMKTCSLANEYIIYISGDSLKGQILDLTEKSFIDAIIPRRLLIDTLQKKHTIDFDYNSHKGYIIFNDDYNLYRVDLNGSVLQRLLEHNKTFDLYPGISIDWITDNVYYLNANDDDTERHLMVRAADSHSDFQDQKILYKFSETLRPHALIIHPNLGYLFITIYDGSAQKATIYRINSDGSEFIPILDSKFSVNPITIGIDYSENRLYWFNEAKTEVHHTKLDGSDLKIFSVLRIKDPLWINIHREWIYISNKVSTWRFSKGDAEPEQILPQFQKNNNLVLSAAKGFGSNLQFINDDHPCIVSNGGCDRYCFAVPGMTSSELKTVCGCNDNEVLKDDGKTCTPIIDIDIPIMPPNLL